VVVQPKEDKKFSDVWLLYTPGMKEFSSGPCH